MTKPLAAKLASGSMVTVLPVGAVGTLVVGLQASGLNPFAGSLQAMPTLEEISNSFDDFFAAPDSKAGQAAKTQNQTQTDADAPVPNVAAGSANAIEQPTSTVVNGAGGQRVPGANRLEEDSPANQAKSDDASAAAETPAPTAGAQNTASTTSSAEGRSPAKSTEGSAGGGSSEPVLTAAKEGDAKAPVNQDTSKNPVPPVKDNPKEESPVPPQKDNPAEENLTPPEKDNPIEESPVVDFGQVLIGYGENQYLHGTSYADTLIGATGRDTFDGGLGDDMYLVYSEDILVQESSGAGHDTLVTDISNLRAVRNIEVLKADEQSAIYTPYADVDPLVDGVSASFSMRGGFDTQTIEGGYGSDYLQSSGNTTLLGHAGDDVYIYSGREIIIEADREGVDTILGAVSFEMPSNIENASAYGSSGIDILGNALHNLIVGNAEDNVLSGGAGNDTLVSLGGEDQLIGGAGADIFILSNNEISYISDFQGNDQLVFAINAPPTALSLVQDFTGIAGEWTFSDGLMQLDWNGDAQADSQIFLDNVSELDIDMVSVTSAYVSPL